RHCRRRSETNLRCAIRTLVLLERSARAEQRLGLGKYAEHLAARLAGLVRGGHPDAEIGPDEHEVEQVGADLALDRLLAPAADPTGRAPRAPPRSPAPFITGPAPPRGAGGGCRGGNPRAGQAGEAQRRGRRGSTAQVPRRAPASSPRRPAAAPPARARAAPP